VPSRRVGEHAAALALAGRAAVGSSCTVTGASSSPRRAAGAAERPPARSAGLERGWPLRPALRLGRRSHCICGARGRGRSSAGCSVRAGGVARERRRAAGARGGRARRGSGRS
jgi:hypothetical protein